MDWKPQQINSIHIVKMCRLLLGSRGSDFCMLPHVGPQQWQQKPVYLVRRVGSERQRSAKFRVNANRGKD